MCFKTNGLKNLKQTISMVFGRVPQVPILLNSSKNIKNSYNLHEFISTVVKISRIHIIYMNSYNFYSYVLKSTKNLSVS